MQQLDYSEVEKRLIDRIAARKDIVLATCDKMRVTARSVYCISDGLYIYFITSRAYTKFKQIEKNNNVAICFENVQIEGTAADIGHPLDEKNKAIMEKAADFKAFTFFTKYKNAVLIKIEPKFIEMWENNKRVYFDIEKGTCTAV